MKQTVVIIPALNPSEALIEYVKELTAHQFEHILVVDDGSRAECQEIFNQLSMNPTVTVLRHAVNLGKGRALKYAFNYALTTFGEELSGVITADSDGQHTVEDLLRLKEALESAEAPSLILGMRNFKEESVPPKSRSGNRITSAVFFLLYGKFLQDTQTGLRGIPKQYLYAYLDLPGERFEYEMNMLIYAVIHHQSITQLPIQTVYFNANAETHFRPFWDSLQIYRVIFVGFFRYIVSSLSATGVDLILFKLFSVLFQAGKRAYGITLATIAARIISSSFNFCVNRKAVFGQQQKENFVGQAVRYYILAACQMFASAGLLSWLDSRAHGILLFEKAAVDLVLFFIGYQFQKNWVFRDRNHKEEK